MLDIGHLSDFELNKEHIVLKYFSWKILVA